MKRFLVLAALSAAAWTSAQTQVPSSPASAASSPWQPGPPPRDAANASFWWRVDNPAQDGFNPPRSWYRPTFSLAGAPGPFLPSASPGATTVPAQALDEAVQFAQATNSQALIVVHRGVVQVERYFGGADANTAFSSHSLTKTLLAIAVGAALHDGRIDSLDQPASKWLPEWRDGQRDRITLRQLLAMSGGFKTPPVADPGHRYMQMHYGSDVQSIVRTAPLAYEPGTQFAYDNDNMHPLGLVLERATGQPYERYVSSRVWKALGASDAEGLRDREGGRAMAYCCLWSQPRDWVRLGQMMLDGGRWQGRRVVDEKFLSAMRQPSPANPNFGLQLVLGAGWRHPGLSAATAKQKDAAVEPAAADLFYAFGAGGQLLAFVPSEQLLILRAGKSSPAWREYMLPNLLVNALHPERKADASAISSVLYDWRMATRSATPNPFLLDATKPAFWPTERVTGGAGAPLPRRSSACLTPEALAPAMAEVQRTRSDHALIWHDGAVVGEYHAPERALDSRHDSASMHKSVVGLLVGQALADGAIPSVDAPVKRWLTEWANDPRGDITVRQMLQMASGLAPIPFDMAPGSAYSRSLYGADNSEQPLAAVLADAPGSRFNYASGVSQLLGLIIERATGKRYAQYLSERLWRPLGAADADVALDRPGGHARTSSGLFARADDWLRLGLLWLDDGRVNGKQVVAPGWLAAMATPSPINPNYGYQLWRGSPHAPLRAYSTSTAARMPARDPFLAEDMLYFDGAGAQRVYMSPQHKLVIVRTGTPSADWDDSRLPNLVMTALQACKAP